MALLANQLLTKDITMRTVYCGQINISYINQEVTLCGWVNRKRDLGHLIFIDMRDREGLIQVCFLPEPKEAFFYASELRNEFCIQLTGIVRARPSHHLNNNLTTGKIEILAKTLTIISRSDPLPLSINQNNLEDQRLKYRYLDLRRLEMANRIKTRANITSFIRNFMDQSGFIDIETPMLTKATPEGARDYLVPSRMHKGKFYALPQSPQLFKQILMIAGFDRYYQIAKCFRDEDLRADRQPEFTQVDVEASFISTEKIRKIIERLIRELWNNIKGIELGEFPQITYADAIRRFGSDKPDLRNPIEIIDIADLVQEVEFKTFSIPANDIKCRVVALRVPGGAKLSHKQINDYSKYIEIYGARGLSWMKVHDDNINAAKSIYSPLTKYLSDKIIKKILVNTGAQIGDILFFAADSFKIVNDSMGALRLKIGMDLKLTNENCWSPLWVIDFPMFQETNNKLSTTHHPFTAPKEMDIENLEYKPLTAIANAYDIVINGYEVGSGSARIICSKMQQKVFSILGMTPSEQHDKFGFLLDAMKYGIPPHAGMALGLDRIVMLLTGADNIRDVIPFPKTTAAADLMTEAPSKITTIDALSDLNLHY